MTTRFALRLALLLLVVSFPLHGATNKRPPADDKSAATDSKKSDGKDSKEKKYDEKVFAGLELRGIGPALTSGRIADLAVDPRDPRVWFVAVASGGVWKTTNAGTTFTPVFDGEGSFSIGAVTLDPSDANTVWVGTGENNSQRSSVRRESRPMAMAALERPA